MDFTRRNNFHNTNDKAVCKLKTVLIITVNYMDASPTRNLIKSVESLERSDEVDLIIVDNKSTDKTQQELNRLRNKSTIDINIISSKQNRYYWGGAALAIEKTDLSQYQWVLICNNDIEFNDDKIFQKLSNLNHDEYQIIAPQIKSTKSQKNLNPFLLNPISRIQDIYYSLYYANTLTAKSVHAVGSFLNQGFARRILDEVKGVGGSIINNQKSKNQKIYAPHGSCMIFSNHYFTKGGYLDTGFTMYGEEVSTAEIAKILNTNIYYIPELSLVHHDHQSTVQSNWKTNYNHSKETYLYIKKKYRS